jgi:hypothetical protein
MNKCLNCKSGLLYESDFCNKECENEYLQQLKDNINQILKKFRQVEKDCYV